MCSRFDLNAPPREIVARFGLRIPPNLPGPVVRPTDAALAITAEGARLLRFGMRVEWNKQPVINARAETLASRPTFRAMLEHRCLLPASHWVEWQGERGAKTRWRLRPTDQTLFSLAGLMRGEEFVVLTCPPSPAIAFVHNRMPVVLPAEAEARWLDPTQPFAALLIPYPGPLEAILDDKPAQSSLFE